ncbi:hypothetical protein BDR22DRAFT_967478 [Usnea florida]
MASKSYYTVDERTRRSVMAAQGMRIDEVHEASRERLSRDFDQNAFLATIGNVEAVIEGMCLNGTQGWEDVTRLQPDVPRLSSRLVEGDSVPPVLLGHDRATLSLYDPIQNLGEMCDSFHSQVNAWATKATYLSEASSATIARDIAAATTEAESARTIREALEFVGPINRAYVRRFTDFGQSMVEPLLELHTLERFIASILAEKYETFVDDSKQEEAETAANPQDGVPSGVKGQSVIARCADSKLSFPVDATTLPALALALPSLTLDESSRDPAFSSLLQERSTFYDTKPETVPQGTPQWKIDLSERKGHKIHLLHVGDSELDILAKCLSYLYNAAVKAEECFGFIIEKKKLAKDTKKKYEELAGACELSEGTFRKVGKVGTSTKKGGDRLEYDIDDHTNEWRRRLSPETPPSGSPYVPNTIDLDTAIGYVPHNDVDAYASGYHQLRIAAQSSFPSLTAQPQPRRQPSILDLEDYDLDSRCATPTPTHHIGSSSPLFSLGDISISSPSDFKMSSPSSSDDEGSEDSDRTIRMVDSATQEGEGVRRYLGSPVPFADDDDDMHEGDDGSEEPESMVGMSGLGNDGAQGAGAYPRIEEHGTVTSGLAGTSTTFATAAAQNDQAAHNGTTDDNDSNADEHATHHTNTNVTKSLLDRNGRRLGIFGEEL